VRQRTSLRSGPRKARQYHLHQLDAALAPLAAARPLNAGRIFYATEGYSISFTQFMDAFAHRVGRRMPLHLPSFAKVLARVIIREGHMQQTALPMPSGTPTPRVTGWRPSFRTIGMGSIRSSGPGATEVASIALRWCRFVYRHKPFATTIRLPIRCRPSILWLCSVPHGEMSADCVFFKRTRHFVLPRLQVSGAGSRITITSESLFSQFESTYG
jgi:hypothetical protein